jgi:hypothetical protein
MHFEFLPKKQNIPAYTIRYHLSYLTVYDINTISIKNLLIAIQMLTDIKMQKNKPIDINSMCPICFAFFSSQYTKKYSNYIINKLNHFKSKYNPDNITIEYYNYITDVDITYYDEYNSKHPIKIHFDDNDILEISNHKVTYKIIDCYIKDYSNLDLAVKFLELEEGKLKQMLRSDNEEIFNLGLDLLKIN